MYHLKLEYGVASGMEMEFYRTNNVINKQQSANGTTSSTSIFLVSRFRFLD